MLSKDGTGPGGVVQVSPERNEENTHCEAKCQHAETKKATPVNLHPRDVKRM